MHVWAVNSLGSCNQVHSFRSLLSKDELARASRFGLDEVQDIYTITHGLLRLLLSQYLACRPGDLRFVEGTHGKPELIGSELKFNISHSARTGLLAFTRGRDIGVDVERMNPQKATDQLAKRAFSEWEYKQIAALGRDQRTEAFFNCWTRKEAFIKALGKGLTFPLDAFDVSMQPGRTAQLLRVEGSNKKGSGWTMRSFMPFPGYPGAVVAQGRDWNLSRFLFPTGHASWIPHACHEN